MRLPRVAAEAAAGSAQLPAAAAVAFLVAVIALSPVLRLSFLADDFVLLERARSPQSAAWPGSGGGFLRPLTQASVSLDEARFGLDPRGHHRTSLLLHALAAALVAALAAAWFRLTGGGAGTGFRTLAAGVLFAVWPCHGEAVAWIAGRGDVLAAALGLAALALWVPRHPGAAVRRGLALTCLSAALLAKESVITLPLVALAVASARNRGRGWARARAALAEATPWFAVLAAYLALRLATLGRAIGGYGAGLHLNPDPVHLAANLARFAARSVLPWPVLAPLVEGSRSAAIALAAGAGVALLAAVAAVRRARALSVADRGRLRLIAVAYLVSLVPVVNLGVSTHTAENERLLYLPSAFAVLGVVELVAALGVRPATRWAAAGVLALGCLAAQAAALVPWRAASRAADAILADLRASGSGRPVVLLGIPDSIQGASVFRHGLPEALRLHGIPTPATVVVLAVLAAPGDRTVATSGPDGLALRGSSPRDRLYSGWRDPVSGVVRLDAAGRLPAGGFLAQSHALTVDLASFGAVDARCFLSPGLGPCPAARR